MSTGLPIEILSSMKGQTYTSFCRLDIDIHRYNDHYIEVFQAIIQSDVYNFHLLVEYNANIVNHHLLGTSLTFMYMKNETTRSVGMVLKFR